MMHPMEQQKVDSVCCYLVKGLNAVFCTIQDLSAFGYILGHLETADLTLVLGQCQALCDAICSQLLLQKMWVCSYVHRCTVMLSTMCFQQLYLCLKFFPPRLTSPSDRCVFERQKLKCFIIFKKSVSNLGLNPTPWTSVTKKPVTSAEAGSQYLCFSCL